MNNFAPHPRVATFEPAPGSLRTALNVLKAWLAAEGDPRPLVVAGPTGIGKSTILGEFQASLSGSTHNDVIVLGATADEARFAHNVADRLGSAAHRANPGTRIVVLLDGTDRLPADERRMLFGLLAAHAGIRVVLTATHEGQFEQPVHLLAVPPLTGPTDGSAAGADLVLASEVARFFLHRLRRHNPTVRFTDADVGSVGRICASSFGIPSDVAALADCVHRHDLGTVDAAVSEDGPRHRLAELLGEEEAHHLALSVDEMVVLASIFTAPGGAGIGMLQQSLPRCDIGRLTRSLVERGLIYDGEIPEDDGRLGMPSRFHLRVTGLPVASWCASRAEVPLAAIRQAQADYLSVRIRSMGAQLCTPAQQTVFDELRFERRNLLCVVSDLLQAHRYAQAVMLMSDALPLLARICGVIELLPYALQVLREYAPTAAPDAFTLNKVAVQVLLAGGEPETAAVCFDGLLASRAAQEATAVDQDLELLGVLVADRLKSQDAIDVLARCVQDNAAARDLVRLGESATVYFVYLMRSREFERVEHECRALLFEATRSGDAYTAGLLLLWRAAAEAAVTGSAENLTLQVERALSKLRRLGPEAVMSVISRVIRNPYTPARHVDSMKIAMVLGALGKVDWPWIYGPPTYPCALPRFAERLAENTDTRTLERWLKSGEGWDLVDLLCQILQDCWSQGAAELVKDHPLGVLQAETVEPGRLRNGTGLTPRESEVASLVAVGLTNRQIAHRLHISEWTVINHLRQVMRKLSCASRVHVANWVRTVEVPLQS